MEMGDSRTQQHVPLSENVHQMFVQQVSRVKRLGTPRNLPAQVHSTASAQQNERHVEILYGTCEQLLCMHNINKHLRLGYAQSCDAI